MDLNPYSLFDKALGISYAQDAQDREFPTSGGYNDRADAFRHMLWMANLQNKYGRIPAQGVGLFKEMVDRLTGNANALESEMDLNNNQLALDLFKGIEDPKELERLIKLFVKQAQPASNMKEAKKVRKSFQPMYIDDLQYNPNMRIEPDPLEDSLK